MEPNSYSQKSSKRRWTPMLLVVSLVCVWLACIGLMHVLTKNNIHAIGRKQRAVELEIAELEQSALSTHIKIEESLARSDLMEKLMKERTKLVKIKSEDIIHLTINRDPPPLPKDPDLQ